MRLPEGPIIIVGGSGFIGSNLADSYLRDGEEVIVLDNLSRGRFYFITGHHCNI